MPLLVDNAKNWWKMWSIRLAAVASTLFSLLLAYPDILLTTLNDLPADVRAALPPFAGIAIFALVTFVRLYRQKNNG